MPDSFFSTPKPRKRKRSDTISNAVGPKKLARSSKDGKVKNSAAKKKVRDDLSDQTDGELDDMDLRADEADPWLSGDEDETETPAEKRLRLAQLYLDSLKTSLGVSL